MLCCIRNVKSKIAHCISKLTIAPAAATQKVILEGNVAEY